VVTNDSWYGYSTDLSSIKKLLFCVQLKTEEPLYAPQNGGISCMIDPTGKIINSTNLFTKAELVVDAPLNNETTFYTMHPLLIPLFCSSFSVITIVFFIYIKLPKKLKKSS
jgi:apolipoprotein N-acyltransferase